MDQWIDKKGLRGVYENSSAIEKLKFKEKFNLDKRMKKESEIFPYFLVDVLFLETINSNPITEIINFLKIYGIKD